MGMKLCMRCHTLCEQEMSKYYILTEHSNLGLGLVFGFWLGFFLAEQGGISYMPKAEYMLDMFCRIMAVGPNV